MSICGSLCQPAMSSELIFLTLVDFDETFVDDRLMYVAVLLTHTLTLHVSMRVYSMPVIISVASMSDRC